MIQINKEPIYDNTSVKLTLFHSSEKRILFGKFVFKYKNYNWKTYSVHNHLNFSQVLGDRTHHPPFWHPTPFFFSKINKLMFCFHFHGLEICKTAIICRFLIASVDWYVYRNAVFWLHQSTRDVFAVHLSSCVCTCMCIYLFSCSSVPVPQLLILHCEYLVWCIVVVYQS